MGNEIKTKSKKAEEVLKLIKLRSKSHFTQTYINILSAESSFLKTDNIKKVWAFNIGSAGIGKTYNTKDLFLGKQFKKLLFQNIAFLSDFSPQAFQDNFCAEHCTNEIVLVPELDELFSDEEATIKVLKNLYDGEISKVLKKEDPVDYYFDSVIISGANIIRKHDKYKPIYDRFLPIFWEGKSDYVLENRENFWKLRYSEFKKIQNYLIGNVGVKVSNLKQLERNEIKILNNNFKYFVKKFNIVSNRFGNEYNSLTKIHSLFIGEKEISKDSANFMLNWFVNNHIQYKIFTKSYKYSYQEEVINALKNDLFSKHKRVNKNTLVNFLIKQTNYSKSYVATGYISKLTRNNILKVIRDKKRYYYEIISKI